MMMATAPSASHMISHVPLNTTEGRIRSLLKEYAPQELDPEVFEYLSSLLSSGEREPNHNDMVDMISQFFGQGHEHEAKELVDRVSELTLKENKNEIVPRNTKLFPLGTTTTMPVELAHKKTEETTSTSDDSSARSTNKEQEHQQKRETQREARRKQRKADQQNDNVFVDDDISAWAERKAEGKTWGGRGFGGRGVRGDVNTPSNIHLTNVTLSFAGNELLQNSTIQINKGHRYGLIGRNGVGKTTLLRRLASKAIPGMPQNMRIVLVEQAAEGGKQSALQALMDSDEERHALLEKQAHLEEQFDKHMSGESLEEIVEQLEEVAVELDAVDADRSEERAKEILGALQFTDNMMQTQTENLSGGWRMRLALAQALFLPSDLLLLDEPTNFLDLHALVWLSDYLVHSEHTLIVVSHDRVFLDMCTDIISMEHKKLVYHVGNYSAYEQQQEEKASREAQILDASERQRAKAISFIQKQEASANKKRQDPKKQRQAKMVKEKKLERIGNYRDDGKRYKTHSLKKLSEDHLRLAQKVVIEADQPILRLKFPDPTWPPGMMADSPLLQMEDLSFGYTKGKPPLLNDLTLQLNRSSKIAIVGCNGAGKSTLLKLITGENGPNSSCEFKGTMWRHPSLRIGHVSQHSVEALDEYGCMPVVEYADKFIRPGKACSSVISSAAGNIRQYLGAFGLGGKHAHRAISSLSGGEHMRLSLAEVFSKQPHLLCLDEPTNFLDMETLDSLAAALDTYRGAVIIVSHDQAFLSRFCKDLWVVENGSVDARHADSSFDELFSEYRSEAIAGVSARFSKRQQKTTMAKRAQQQRSGAKQHTGFIP